MVDNVSFVDEVNKVPRNPCHMTSSSAPRDTSHMTSGPDSHKPDDNSTRTLLNNNYHYPTTYGTYSQQQQQQQQSPGRQCGIGVGDLGNNGNMATVSPDSCCHVGRGSGKHDRDTALWLTRSVTQPELNSNKATNFASLIPTPASAHTQSEESVPQMVLCSSSSIQRSGEVNLMSTMPSSPSSYDALPGEVTGEYYDARSSFSAPVELLSEFLSALMSRDYETALNLCQSILKYEPHNATAVEFYPLLMNKMKQCATTDDDTDATSDYVDVTDRDDDDDEEEEKVDIKSKLTKDDLEKTKVNDKAPQPSHHKKKKRPTPTSREDASIQRTKSQNRTDQTLCPGNSMSASNSMDFSAGQDSGRDSLFSPSDSDFTVESGDSLYSSTESNLNMIRSGSDSLFSSTDSGLTLESVVKAVKNLGVDGR